MFCWQEQGLPPQTLSVRTYMRVNSYKMIFDSKYTLNHKLCICTLAKWVNCTKWAFTFSRSLCLKTFLKKRTEGSMFTQFIFPQLSKQKKSEKVPKYTVRRTWTVKHSSQWTTTFLNCNIWQQVNVKLNFLIHLKCDECFFLKDTETTLSGPSLCRESWKSFVAWFYVKCF